ncbi:MAG: ArnT family glycosyltransferase [Ktedonobacteraceae bacterium]
MTVSYRPTQDQDPQESGSQQGQGARPHNKADSQFAPPGSPQPAVEPNRRKVFIKPPVTPPAGTRFFNQESNGQNPPASNQQQAVEQLPTSALPAPPPLSSNRAQTIEQLRAAAMAAGNRPPAVEQARAATPTPPAPPAPVNNQPPAVEQVRAAAPARPASPAPAMSNRQQMIERAETFAMPGVSPVQNSVSGSNAPARTREPGMLRNAPGAGYMAYTAPAPPPEMVQQGPKPEVENGNIILYRTHNFFLRTVYRPGQRQNPIRKPTGHTTVMPRVMPNQERRIAASETRVMPSVNVNTTKQTRAIPIPAWAEAIMVTIALMGVLLAHVYNMFNFPRFELDEGTYMSNAWAITQGMLSPYSYGYGHPPLGWIQIAGWLQLTGGPFTFGNAINSGRVFMLFYAVGSALLVYLIARRMTGSRSAALLALVIFSFSPLSITYQRQVFLDNIATFWMLLSLYLLVASTSRLKYIVGAALAFGVAFLSKEVILVCFPALIYAAWLFSTKFQRKFSMVTFVYGVIAVASVWVLLAVLKGELFPYGWLPWDHHDHLSFIGTFLGQAARSESNGSFADSWAIWIDNDPILIIASLAAPAFNLIYGWWNRKHLMAALLLLSYWLLLARGGQTLSFYIIPIIPLAAINIVLAINAILSGLVKVVRFDVIRAVLLIVTLAAVLPFDIKETGFRFYQHPTSAQDQAMVWVRANVPHNAFIVINSYPYLDLRLPGGQGVGNGAPYPHAEIYWSVAYDPVLFQNTLQKNWDRIDYIVADSEMLTDFKTFGPNNIINQAMQHVVLRAQFSAQDHSSQIVVYIYQVIHKSAQPTAMNGQPSGNGALAAISSSAPRGDPLVANERKWYISLANEDYTHYGSNTTRYRHYRSNAHV